MLPASRQKLVLFEISSAAGVCSESPGGRLAAESVGDGPRDPGVLGLGPREYCYRGNAFSFW